MTANIQLYKDIKLNLHNYERVGIYRGRSIDVITANRDAGNVSNLLF